MKHPIDFEKLAEEVSNLRYDSLPEFLKLLAQKLSDDSDEDFLRQRPSALLNASVHISNARRFVNQAWDICEPYMSDGDLDETLKRYQDELDELDPPEDIGEYITSYTKNHLVDVHVFQSNLGIEVLVNKRKDISVAEAQRIKNEALALYGATPVRTIYNIRGGGELLVTK